MSLTLGTAPPVFPQTDLESLKNRTYSTPEEEKARLKQAAKEFEAFFMYQLLKTMRQTVPDNPLSENTPFGGGQGKEIYQQMFDMELGRRMADGGSRSISDILYKSLEKLVDAKYNQIEMDGSLNPVTKPNEPMPLEKPSVPIEPATEQPVEIEKEPAALPIEVSRRPHVTDSIMARFGALIDAAAAETKLDSALIASVIRAESNGNPKAVSPVGAKGLMQLMDGTAAELGVTDSFNPKQNILAGSRYLAAMVQRFGDLETALAAYNAGPGTVSRHGGIPPYRETQNYVAKVTRLAREAGSRLVDRPKPVKVHDETVDTNNAT